MLDEESVLGFCTPEFARAWRCARQAMSLNTCFIDIMAVFAFRDDNSAKVVLSCGEVAREFERTQKYVPDNFFMLVSRQDRHHLIDACRKSCENKSIEYVNIKWHLNMQKKESFYPTHIAIEKVGEMPHAQLLYFAVQDSRKHYSWENSLVRRQYADLLSALFDEIFLLDIDSGEHNPIYLGGRPLVDKDGNAAECGFYLLSRSLHPDDRKMFWANSNYMKLGRELFEERTNDMIVFDLRRMENDGKYHWCSIYIVRADNSEIHRHVLVCLQNIDAKKAAQRRERELRSKAERDALTNIYNRGTTEELIRAALQSRAERAAPVFVLVDVDNFKDVNDHYGHSVGDTVLKSVAQCLQDSCDERDIVGRFGGDEFGMLVVGDPMTDVEKVRLQIAQCMEQIKIKSGELGIDPPVTISAGIVSFNAAESCFHDIYEQADRLLYEAKGSGKNDYRLYQP